MGALPFILSPALSRLTRNLMRVLPDNVAEKVMALVSQLNLTRNVEEGKAVMSSLSLMNRYFAKRAKRLLDSSNRCTAFLNFPREVRY